MPGGFIVADWTFFIAFVGVLVLVSASDEGQVLLFAQQALSPTMTSPHGIFPDKPGSCVKVKLHPVCAVLSAMNSYGKGMRVFFLPCCCYGYLFLFFLLLLDQVCYFETNF